MLYRTTGTLIDATLMLQREVADRITAAPGTGEYGVLSISAQLHADVRRVLTLPPGAFRPPPKVHSAVVHFRFRPPAVALADGRCLRVDGAIDIYAAAKDSAERTRAFRRVA